MVGTRFFWKLYASYAVLVVLAVAIVGVLAARRMATDVVQDTEDVLHARAALLAELAAPGFREPGTAELQARIRRLGGELNTRFTLIAADGAVIADSDEDPATMDNHGSRPEVVQARDQAWGMSTRFSRTVAANMMYVALAVREGGTLIGYVRASLPLTSVDEHVAGLRVAVALGGLAAALLALAIGLFVTRRVVAPLTSMTEAAGAIAAGDYGQRVPATSQDEIGTLATTFNRMAGELENRMRTISEDRAKLLTILGGMVEGVVAVDRDQSIVHLNAAARRILGVRPEECVGRPIWELTRVRPVCDAIEQTLAEGGEVTSELQIEVGAQERIVELHGAPLADGGGGLVGAVLVLHDVTELRRLERVRRDFVANVSHELKTPITAIRGLIDTIIDDGDMPPETRAQFLLKVQGQSLRLSLLVTDLLTLTRLESADGQLETERVDVRDVAARSAANFRTTAETRGVSLAVDVPSTPLLVEGDPEALELMLNNLLDNAVKYTAAGGAVRLRLAAEKEEALIEVSDNGIGIATDHHDRIFERFYRVDQARSRELGGTGLGLSIVKHVCKAHHGAVSLESALGVGSTFRVRLPLA